MLDLALFCVWGRSSTRQFYEIVLQCLFLACWKLFIGIWIKVYLWWNTSVLAIILEVQLKTKKAILNWQKRHRTTIKKMTFVFLPISETEYSNHTFDSIIIVAFSFFYLFLLFFSYIQLWQIMKRHALNRKHELKGSWYTYRGCNCVKNLQSHL